MSDHDIPLDKIINHIVTIKTRVLIMVYISLDDQLTIFLTIFYSLTPLQLHHPLSSSLNAYLNYC